MARRSRLHRPVLLVALAVLLASLLPPAQARPAPVGSDPFRPGAAYSGDFPDPSVLRVGNTYYAYSTTIAALSLPAMSSVDLRSWAPRPSSDPDRPWRNDALPEPASWAETRTTSDGRPWAATWAPSVAWLGPGRYVAAYAIPRAEDGRRCLSLAQSASPMGPFTDTSTGPLTCPGYGAIDPQIFRDGPAVWLLYKMEGAPDRILVRRMTNDASALAAGSNNYTLLTPKAAWEGSVVENPAMIRYRRKLYLFYSGNGYGTARYATGYALCRSVVGPCRRMGRLLASGSYLAGPGGATPFFDTAGNLRLAYHAWRTGNVGYPTTDACLQSTAGCAQRRMYIALLGPGRRGRLVLRRWY